MSGVDQDEQITRALSRVGKVLKNKFRLDTLLGVGGMASVYAATHRNQKRVAVKLLHPELSSDVEMKTRFLREGYAANKIGHAGAVSVLDDDISEDGAAFLVMELLEGETLEQLWDRVGPRVNPFEVLEYLDQVLDTLAAAHDKGIVHRDIKPENLFLTAEGKVKILDFGIARVREQGTALKSKMTAAGTVMGTPAFMAPEQARGRWSDVDGRTDLWALAATAHMLLTGHCVHEASNGNEQLIMSATRVAPSIATLDPGLPPQVITIIDRGLNYKMDRRWPNARAMQVAVRAGKENRAVLDPYAGEMSRASQSEMQQVQAPGSGPSRRRRAAVGSGPGRDGPRRRLRRAGAAAAAGAPAGRRGAGAAVDRQGGAREARREHRGLRRQPRRSGRGGAREGARPPPQLRPCRRRATPRTSPTSSMDRATRSPRCRRCSRRAPTRSTSPSAR